MSRSEEVIDSSPDRSVVRDLNPKLTLSMMRSFEEISEGIDVTSSDELDHSGASPFDEEEEEVFLYLTSRNALILF